MNNGRILIIVQNLSVPFDRRVWQEALALKANGYAVSIICPKGRPGEPSHTTLQGIPIYRYSLPFEARNASGYLLEYVWSLICQFYLSCIVFFSPGFDAIHACNPPDNIFLIAGFFKYLFGKKFIFDHHDLCPELYEAKFGRRGFLYKVMLLCERLTFMIADVSIATNESYRDIAIRRGGMPEEKVFVVRSGPDLDRIKIVPSVPRLRHGKKYLVGYLGVMGHQEGIDLLLESIRHIVHVEEVRYIHFTLVGNGPERERLIELAQKKNIGRYVTFAGRLPDYEMLDVLNTADVCVNPDTVNEMNDKSTMNKIMEYMALGKPIVQFDMKEGRISAGEAALYARANDPVDFAEKILTLLDNPHMREKMGAYGRERVETLLAWPYQIPNLLAAYEALFATQSLHEELAWYYYRFRAMWGTEILHRIGEKLKREIDRRISPAAKLSGHSEPAFMGFKEKLQSADMPAALINKWETLRAEVESGQFFFLSQRWPACDRHKKWHLDPVTGKSWPYYKYCFDINFRHTEKLGDVKYVWELNRLQYLQPLAALALHKKDEALATFCLSEIESWIDANPPFDGVNWASGIELALRLTSILIVTELLSEYMTLHQHAKIGKTIEIHAFWLARYPSKFSSGNNHLAAEGLGLFLAGALRPQLISAARWKKRGWKLLCDSAKKLILPDGTGAEQAVSYTAFTLEMLMLGCYVAEHTATHVLPYYRARIELAAEHLYWFTDSQGNHPLIGDDDNGCVIGLHEENYVHSVLAAAAAFSRRKGLALPAVPHLRDILFGIPTGEFKPPSDIKLFRDGGYTVIRSEHRGHDFLLALDHGPLGYLSLAAHGHADALAVWLHIDGIPVLVDAGTYLYHAPGKWRSAFRSTQIHNTLSVEGTDSSTMSGNFNWSYKAKARLLTTSSNWKEWRIEAEHDGYRRRFGLTHRRKLDIHADQGFIIEDSIHSTAARTVEIGFLIHPDLTIAPFGKFFDVEKNGKKIMRIEHEGRLSGSIKESWYAPRFGTKMPASRISFEGTLAPGETALTKFYFL